MVGPDRKWAAVLGIVAALAATPHDAHAGTLAPIDIELTVVDAVGVPADELYWAQHETARIYRSIGIAVEWVKLDDAPTVRPRYVVHISGGTVGGKSKRDPRVLGVAPGNKEVRGRHVWAYYDRIHDFASVMGAKRRLVLALVIAHELGHLLLPYDSHAIDGLMAAAWNGRTLTRADAGLLTFTSRQAGLIRERLSASASPSARAR